ncbi:MAG: BLUF domain-containing protein [Rhodobacteraceae bacterium]|nr:BLUF domain-containing protein [Paracoccaceae bacterium]
MILPASHKFLRIIYTSINRIDLGTLAGRTELQQLAARAQGRNRDAAISGMLIHNESNFGQLLEGPAAAVESTMERIILDPRHTDIAVLECRPTDQRIFETWVSGYVGPDAAYQQNPSPQLRAALCTAAVLPGDVFTKMFDLAESGRLADNLQPKPPHDLAI